MCLDENLKACIKMEGNLKDNLLDLCEKLILSGIDSIKSDPYDKISGCFSVGYGTRIIQKYRLFDQAPTLLFYYHQEFPILNEKIIKKCQDIYLAYGECKFYPDMDRPFFYRKIDNDTELALEDDLDFFFKEQMTDV